MQTFITADDSKKRCRERYASMDPEKKEAYLKKRRESYHKRKALATQSNLEVVQDIVPVVLPMNSSPATPQITNVSIQLAQSPMEFFHKAGTQLFRTPMDNFQGAVTRMYQSRTGDSTMDIISQKKGNQFVQSPMYASQISYSGRNLLPDFQHVMGSPGQHSFLVSIKYYLPINYCMINIL